MENDIEAIEIWEREMARIHALLTKIYTQPHNLHGESWRYGMVKYYWKKRSDLLGTYPKGAITPPLDVMHGVITFLDRMEKIDPM